LLKNLHWLYIVTLGFLTLNPIFNNIDWTPEWITAVAMIASTTIAAIAAFFLRKTLLESRRATVIQNRAYLSCNFIGIEAVTATSFEAVIEWKNLGKTPAYKVAATTIMLSSLQDIAFKKTKIHAALVDSAGYMLGQYESTRTKAVFHKALVRTIDDELGISSLCEPTFLYASCRYMDCFGNSYLFEQAYHVDWEHKPLTGATKAGHISPLGIHSSELLI
jgi:hypothetical protein